MKVCAATDVPDMRGEGDLTEEANKQGDTTLVVFYSALEYAHIQLSVSSDFLVFSSISFSDF